MTTPTAITETTAAATPLPLQLLDDANRAFASGELRKGYRLVWDATMAALEPVAEQQAIPCKTLEQTWELVRDLDALDENGHSDLYPYHFAAFNVAVKFLEQSEGKYDDDPEFRWEGDQFRFYLPAIKHFVNYLTGGEESPVWFKNSTSPLLTGL